MTAYVKSLIPELEVVVGSLTTKKILAKELSVDEKGRYFSRIMVGKYATGLAQKEDL